MSQVERSMTVIERLLHSVYQAFEGDGMPVFAVRCSGPWDETKFRSALAAVQARHPLLRTRIVEPRRCWPKFQLDPAAPAIPVEVHPADSETDWVQTAHQYSQRLFNAEQSPLCRFAVRPDKLGDGFDLIAAFHHSIIDGISMLAILRELFGHMSGEPFSRTPCDEELTFRPMQRTTLWQRCRLIGRLARVQFRQWREPQVLLEEKGEASRGCVRVIWPKEMTTSLVRRCRREKTTVFGALAALSMQTLAEREQWQNAALQLQVPFDIRKDYALPVGRQTLGCFVGILDFWHDRPLSTEFWTLARRCRRDIEYEQAWKMANCFDYLFSRIGFTPQLLQPFRKLTVGVNNLGRCEEVSAGPWRLEEFSWFGRAQTLGASIYLNTATINGRLNLTLHGSHVSQETLQELGDRLTREMEHTLDRRAFSNVSWAA